MGFEIGMYPVDEQTGKTGWQGCNLVEINGGACVNEEIFYEACEAASIIGTLQAGYTNFKFLGEESKKIYEREALLGVSVTGWMNSPDVLFDKRVLKKGAEIVKRTNKSIAKIIGINPSARSCCVKPSGNSSVLLSTASGIHPEHSKRYLRNVQLNKETEVVDLIKESNPYMVEESMWSSSNSDYVVSFPIEPPKKSICKGDLNGINLLEKVKMVQKYWVEEGKDEDLCVDKDVSHNVSNTITVSDDEWDEVEQYLYDNRYSFAGVSLLPASGDKDYVQAPFTSVLTDKEIVKKYGSAALFASGLIVDSHSGFKNLWEACQVASMDSDNSDKEIKDIRKDWIRRFNKFAETFFKDDKKITEYCLKDVYLLYKWEKITANMNPVDFTRLSQKKFVDVDTMGAQGCSGGACEVVF